MKVEKMTKDDGYDIIENFNIMAVDPFPLAPQKVQKNAFFFLFFFKHLVAYGKRK